MREYVSRCAKNEVNKLCVNKKQREKKNKGSKKLVPITIFLISYYLQKHVYDDQYELDKYKKNKINDLPSSVFDAFADM